MAENRTASTEAVRFSDSWASVLLDLVRRQRAKGALCLPIRTLARFSFSLYVLHMPILLFVTAFALGERTWSPKDLLVDALAVAVLVGVLVLAYALATGTEFQNDRVRGWVERRLAAVGYGKGSATSGTQ